MEAKIYDLLIGFLTSVNGVFIIRDYSVAILKTGDSMDTHSFPNLSAKSASPLSRRAFLQAASGVAASLWLAACGQVAASPTARPAATATPPLPVPTLPQTSPTAASSGPSPTAFPTLPPTPMCGDEDDVTPPQTEGPYFTPNSPERTSLLEPGMAGTKMALTGYVVDTHCQPIAGALVDFWHANDAGEYDNVGYTLRGHQFTDATGRYELETIVPGLYPGRTRHFHVKVQAPQKAVLTTQLYFPNEAANRTDGIFNEALVLVVQDGADGKLATFNFVLEV